MCVDVVIANSVWSVVIMWSGHLCYVIRSFACLRSLFNNCCLFACKDENITKGPEDDREPDSKVCKPPSDRYVWIQRGRRTARSISPNFVRWLTSTTGAGRQSAHPLLSAHEHQSCSSTSILFKVTACRMQPLWKRKKLFSKLIQQVQINFLSPE